MKVSFCISGLHGLYFELGQLGNFGLFIPLTLLVPPAASKYTREQTAEGLPRPQPVTFEL